MIETYKKKIISFYENNKRMPGYAEIMKLTGFKSKNAVYKLINKLVEMGVIYKDAQGKITPAFMSDEVPFLGYVEAGLPSLAEEDLLDTIDIDSYLIPHKENSYILEVKGDSMIDEGIKEGDYVIVEKKSDAKDGEIVIAEVDGGYTMKYLKKQGSKIFLRPANKDFKDIYPTESFAIVAVVKGVIRKY
jgi:repressor LexA